jgi:hypothetical protein
MKAILIYWIIGCFVIGPAIAGRMNDCPNDKVEATTIVSMVAVWPVALIAAIGLKSPDKSCRSPSPPEGKI